jgi:hypothetical protein
MHRTAFPFASLLLLACSSSDGTESAGAMIPVARLNQPRSLPLALMKAKLERVSKPKAKK